MYKDKTYQEPSKNVIQCHIEFENEILKYYQLSECRKETEMNKLTSRFSHVSYNILALFFNLLWYV